MTTTRPRTNPGSFLLASVALMAALLLPGLATAQTAIDPAKHHAWSENAGWVDFRTAFGATTVFPKYLTGYAWSENVGWVKLGVSAVGPYLNTSQTNWGVNFNLVSGQLSGFAWSENAGWIRFDHAYGGVTYSTLTSEFDGYAWAENLGYIHFKGTSTGTSTPYGVGTVPAGTVMAIVSGGGSICPGQNGSIQAALTGAPPWRLTWSDGVTQSAVTTSPATRSVSPSSTAVYTVTTVSDSTSFGTSTGSATVTVLSRPTAVAGGTATIELGQFAPLTGSGGSSCAWLPVTGLDDPASCTPNASPTATATYSLTVTDSCSSTNLAQVTITVTPPSATSYYAVTPCRLFDTRNISPPILAAGEVRPLSIVGLCGLPATAKALSVNVTVTQPGGDGRFTLFPGDLTSPPVTSSVEFTTGKTRASCSMLELSRDGLQTFKVFNSAPAAAHFILDVNGYFE